MNEWFRRIAEQASSWLGSSTTFTSAVGLVLLWLVTGPLFQWSDTWQLAMNTVTSVLAFLMVFLIQNTQNRDTRAVLLKLDELLRANREARTSLVHLEELTDAELDALAEEFRRLRASARR